MVRHGLSLALALAPLGLAACAQQDYGYDTGGFGHAITAEESPQRPGEPAPPRPGEGGAFSPDELPMPGDHPVAPQHLDEASGGPITPPGPPGPPKPPPPPPQPGPPPQVHCPDQPDDYWVDLRSMDHSNVGGYAWMQIQDDGRLQIDVEMKNARQGVLHGGLFGFLDARPAHCPQGPDDRNGDGVIDGIEMSQAWGGPVMPITDPVVADQNGDVSYQGDYGALRSCPINSRVFVLFHDDGSMAACGHVRFANDQDLGRLDDGGDFPVVGTTSPDRPANDTGVSPYYRTY